MKIIEKNTGTKIAYELNGTDLSFADGALTMDLARYQRDGTVMKDIMVDTEGNLVIGKGRYYAAQVEIPPREYEEEVIPTPEQEGESGGETIKRTPLPLNTDDVTMYLFAIDGIVIY